MITFSLTVRSSVPNPIVRDRDFTPGFIYEPLARAMAKELVPGHAVAGLLLGQLTTAPDTDETTLTMIWLVEMNEASR